MKIFITIVLLFLFVFIAKEIISKNKKTRFRIQIESFTIKFLQPLIWKDKKYQPYPPVSVEKAKIFMRLLKDEFRSDYININSNIEIIKVDKTTGQEYILSPKAQDVIEQTYWSLKDSLNYLNEKFFDLLFKKFIKQFASDNPECTDDWNKIKKCYIKTFDSNMRYLNFISKYIELKQIELSFENSIENLEKDVFSTIEEISLDKKVSEYKKVIDNSDSIKELRLTIADIDNMTGIEFEKLLEKLFTDLNYKVEITKATGDQGADLIISKLNERMVVQAKRYNSHVSNKAIQEAIGAIKFYNADSAIVVTNNYFTKSALELASANNVELWDRDYLIKQLKFNILEI